VGNIVEVADPRSARVRKICNICKGPVTRRLN
jgi:hypothetical protein